MSSNRPAFRLPFRADDGLVVRVSVEEVWSALGATAGVLLGMVAWDASSHDEWIGIDGKDVFLPPPFRFILRWGGVALAARVVWQAWREDAAPARVRLAGREFVPGRRPTRERS